MIYTSNNLLEKYKDYHNPKTKINRLLHQQKLFSLSKGVYTDDKDLHPFIVAPILWGPSYISFHTALAYYNLIPERVFKITCASFNKHKDKKVNNHFGNYHYSDIPINAYPYGVLIKKIGQYTYYIASPEKALCDLLYKLPPIKSVKQLKILLFENLRIEEDDIFNLNANDINFLVDKYHCTNINYLNKLLRRKHDK